MSGKQAAVVQPVSLHFHGACMQDTRLILETLECLIKDVNIICVLHHVRQCTDNEPHLDLAFVGPEDIDPHPLISEWFELVFRQLADVPCDA